MLADFTAAADFRRPRRRFSLLFFAEVRGSAPPPPSLLAQVTKERLAGAGHERKTCRRRSRKKAAPDCSTGGSVGTNNLSSGGLRPEAILRSGVSAPGASGAAAGGDPGPAGGSGACARPLSRVPKGPAAEPGQVSRASRFRALVFSRAFRFHALPVFARFSRASRFSDFAQLSARPKPFSSGPVCAGRSPFGLAVFTAPFFLSPSPPAVI